MARQKRIWWVLSALVIVVAATLSAGTMLTWMLQQQSTHTDSYTAAQIKSVQLNTGPAKVQVHPANGGTARVTQTMQWVFTKPTVVLKFDPSSGTLNVDASCEGARFLADKCAVQLDITVPATAEVVSTGGSGQLSVTAMAGPVTAQFGSGEVDLNRASGPLDIRVGSGQISGTDLQSDKVNAVAGSGEVDLGFAAPPTTVTAGATSGQVSVAVPSGTQYRVNASVTSGESDVAPGLSSFSAPGTIAVSVTSGQAEVHYR
ncbi:hypothetical protein DN069_08695 [Streptacidiphilus pinicola]|uniref:DUF4097 domain-containing protein n=1 Tax=Streptacidiphilus pinicola TaxID=2219663 RepID=A0A2X0JES1_9ACTN|nr:DUF4097 family beta strand repeat-containing protein [Streptacidiphilus pinicola]RAG86078.1 hypothetical protein DN069_08695 [Streptacidiphilus pinicola]